MENKTSRIFISLFFTFLLHPKLFSLSFTCEKKIIPVIISTFCLQISLINVRKEIFVLFCDKNPCFSLKIQNLDRLSWQNLFSEHFLFFPLERKYVSLGGKKWNFFFCWFYLVSPEWVEFQIFTVGKKGFVSKTFLISFFFHLWKHVGSILSVCLFNSHFDLKTQSVSLIFLNCFKHLQLTDFFKLPTSFHRWKKQIRKSFTRFSWQNFLSHPDKVI